MKQVVQFVFAGMIGGIITLGGYFALQVGQPVAAAQNESFAKQVNNVNVPPTANVPFDFTQAASIATPAVVHISAKESEKKAREGRQRQQNQPWPNLFDDDSFLRSPFFNFNQPKQGTGSGVIYTADGYIITNNHVVEFADEVEVTTFDNKTYPAKIIGTYPDGDLAVLKIEAKNLPTLRMGNSDEAKIGEWVLAVGNPLELNSTVTAGIISAKGRDINIIKGKAPIESFIQTDAAVNPGNSGGALVDANGRLLGINTAIATQTGYFEGYSFAIPINLAVGIVDDIIENGSYQRGFLGINIADLDNAAADELGLYISQCVLVESVVDGGAAQYAGVLPNDVIVQANGKNVKSSADLLEVVGGSKAGQTVALVVNRSGKEENISVRLKGQDANK
ncbi:MAG: trypsin-like peptidase domain-containing protein [Saprospiraceae bacterium]|nr:trypsin-like peptidase domain-containing protein [Saprospiraceae bacterium]